MRRQSAIVIATAAPAAAMSTWDGHRDRIVLDRFDPRIGKDRIYSTRPEGTGLHPIMRLPGCGEWL